MTVREQVVIDLNPYDVDIEGSIAILREAPIDLTIPERFRNVVIHHGHHAGEIRFQYLYLHEEPFLVEQVGPDWRITRHGGTIGVFHVVSVIRQNFDALIDLRWEALRP